LHEFEKEGVCYTDYVDEELPAVQYDGMRVSDLLKEKGDEMIYRNPTSNPLMPLFV
jgi:hypothetical protein